MSSDAGAPNEELDAAAANEELDAAAANEDLDAAAPPLDPRVDAAVPPTNSTLLYRLAVRKRFGVPLVNATGIACDGDYVWLSSGLQIAHANLETGEVDRMFDVELPVGGGVGAYGITKLDDTIYVSIAGNVNAIASIDATTGKVIKQIKAPTVLGPSDLDVSEGRLVESSGTGDVFVLELATGAVLHQFPVNASRRDTGVAVRGDEAFVAGLFEGVDVYRLSTGKPIGRATKTDGTELKQEGDVGPMCFRGETLLILSTLGITEYELMAPE